MEKARRRQMPAFGEWNYYYSPSSSPDEPPVVPLSGAAMADSWWYAPAEPEACSDVWFRYSPPPRNPPAPKKVRRPRVANGGLAPAENPCYSDGRKGSALHGAWPTVFDASAVARAPAKGGRRVVRPVDEDLYRVPPPDDIASGRSRRKRAARSSWSWMGCLGLRCVA